MFTVEQGKPVKVRGSSYVCFHGVCGGGVDRGVICPAALQRPNGR